MIQNTLKSIVLTLIVVGALNWGFIGASDLNLVEYLFGAKPLLVRVLYMLVGISGVIVMAGVILKPFRKPRKAGS